MSFDPAAIRAQFPIFRAEPGLHYLDSAATSQIHDGAFEALAAYESRARANVKRGIYRLAAKADEAYQDARLTMARYLGAADPAEIVFTSGTTMGLNLLAHALGSRLSEGDEVVLSELEHHSNVVPWQMLRERRGVVLRVIPVTDDGRMDLRRLEDFVTERCRLIAVTHCSNVTGALTDVARLVEAARAVGAHLVLDGAQRAPHGPLDVQALGIDAYALSGHKMFGATGAGALWVRRALLEELPPFLGGGEMIRTVSFARTSYAGIPHRFEAGTPPIGAAIAMAASARWLMTLDWQAALAHELALTERVLDGLSTLDGVRVIGPSGLQGRLGVVSFAADGVHPHDICQMLDDFDVCLRGGHHCAQPLMEAFGLAATARASLAPYNTGADIDALLDGLDRTLARLR